MSYTFDSRVRLREQVLKRNLDDESLMLNMDSERYFGLNDVGTHMLDALAESDSIQQAYERLVSEYDVEPDVLRKDLIQLIDRLSDSGIIEVVKNQSSI